MTGYERIAKERSRQIHEEGYDPAHDDQHAYGEIAQAAGAYCLRSKGWWPWEPEGMKLNIDPNHHPDANERIRELEKAGALVAAEIDRLQRLVGS